MPEATNPVPTTGAGGRVTRERIVRWLDEGRFSDRQVDEIVKRIQHWELRHPVAPRNEREPIWNAIVADIDYSDLAEVGEDYTRARSEAEEQRQRLRASVYVACVYGGMSAAEAARQAGVSRQTVVAWINDKSGDDDE